VLLDKSEVLPPGWELLETTVGGESGNVNNGSWSGYKTHVCYRRRKASRDASRHVVDVAVGYGGKCPPGFVQVARSVSGSHDGNLSRQSSKLYETHLCVKYSTPPSEPKPSRAKEDWVVPAAAAAAVVGSESSDTAAGDASATAASSAPPGGDAPDPSSTTTASEDHGDDDSRQSRSASASSSSSAGAFASSKALSDPRLYHTERSLVEVGLFVPSPGERCPGQFVERGENFNRGLGTSRVHLCLRFGPRLGLCDLPLVPQVLDRLPKGSVWVHREGNDDMGGVAGVVNSPGGVTKAIKPSKKDKAEGKDKGFSGDVFELTFPDAVPMFCFPRGVRLKRASRFAQPSPQAFSFVFTEDMGRRVFVSCLVFYEVVPWPKVEALAQSYRTSQVFWDDLDVSSEDGDEEDDDEEDEENGGGSGGGAATAESAGASSRGRGSGSGGGGGGGRARALSATATTPPLSAVKRAAAVAEAAASASRTPRQGYAEGDDQRVWAPQCLCLMSHWPVYGSLRTGLRHLWSFCLSRCQVPLERHLGVLLATPMPRPGAPPIHLQLDLGLVDTSAGETPRLAPLILHQPPLRGLPLMDLDFTMPFHSLSTERLLAVFGLMLKETPLLFLSASPTRLTETIEVLRALLFPLDYKV
jgi:hypothetical protein